MQGTLSCIQVFLTLSASSSHVLSSLIFDIIVKMKVTVLEREKRVNKKPTYLSVSETKQVLIAVRVERVLSLQMNFVSSRSCRHQRL